jgi:hypothetical protein
MLRRQQMLVQRQPGISLLQLALPLQHQGH